MNLMTLSELAAELDVPPPVLRHIAHEFHLPLSVTGLAGTCIHRRDLNAWRRAVALARDDWDA